MHTITGSTLVSTSGEKIGEIVDIVGATGADFTPEWITVKTGFLSQRLVPFRIVDEEDGRFTAPCTPDQVKNAPKVEAHVEPSHHEVEQLCAHYGIPQPSAS